MFRSLISAAALVGVVSGLLLTAAQSMGVTPILLAAEQYEADTGPTGSGHSHDHGHGDEGHHHHGSGTWAPDSDAERLFFTALSNVLAGIGFAAILLVIMTRLQEHRRLALTPVFGLLVGLISYVSVFVAPAIGLPPEVPATISGDLENRQFWWIATVVMVATGLSVLCLASGWKKLAGLPLLGLPYLFVPSRPEGPLFANSDPSAVAALNDLHLDFIWVSALTNLAFWLVVGVLCAVILNRLLGTRSGSNETTAT